MSSEGEAEAAAESGPGSTPAPGAAAAEREEVSGGGGVSPGPGDSGGAKAAPRRGRGAGRWGVGGGGCRGWGCLRCGEKRGAQAQPGRYLQPPCAAELPCGAGAAGGTPRPCRAPGAGGAARARRPLLAGFCPRAPCTQPCALGRRLCTETMQRGRKGACPVEVWPNEPLGVWPRRACLFPGTSEMVKETAALRGTGGGGRRGTRSVRRGLQSGALWLSGV